jgi:hypothetical protein
MESEIALRANTRGSGAGLRSGYEPRFADSAHSTYADPIMTTRNRCSHVLLVGTVFVAACGRDTQTDRDVVTSMADGTVATSISGDSADERGVALVRVVTAVPDMQRVVVRGDNLRELPAVDYQQVSPYTSIDRNWVRFEVSSTSAGPYTAIDTNREMLTDGRRYTMLILREEDGAQLTTRILRDQISADGSKAHLRLIHAARGTEEINVVARGGETLIDGVDYGSDGDYEDVLPWSGTIELRSEDGNRLLLTLPNIEFQAGTSYTLVVTRRNAGALSAFWFADTPAVQ